MIGHLHTRQYVSFVRMKELSANVFESPISGGGIHCLLHRFAERSTTTHQTIKERVSSSKVIGTDGTGEKVNENKR